ncbi:hypothetical protein [Granulicella mallensis]|uniref:Uncharacterized protein n=1 Tax=Granulicella mallensis TaxID=940614 RepID=A0A7W7ZR34_9BACT|nr:hypothetical protein [Granulicella mallensis]MBB5064197.1 hypothetical protein [Granulicella mallensis]
MSSATPDNPISSIGSDLPVPFEEIEVLIDFIPAPSMGPQPGGGPPMALGAGVFINRLPAVPMPEYVTCKVGVIGLPPAGAGGFGGVVAGLAQGAGGAS